MLVSEEFKYILVSKLSRCSDTVCAILVSLTANVIVIKMYITKLILFCEIFEIVYFIINLLPVCVISCNFSQLGQGN